MSRLAETRRKNHAYLSALIAKELKPIPSRYALEVGIRLYTRMINETVVDSGQAAANWQFIPYVTSPRKGPQKMLWGYDDVEPTSPVGWKSWYSGGAMKGGDVDQIAAHLSEIAEDEMMTSSLNVRGVLVYNPITPGFADFAPGNDANYEQNALETAYISAPAARTAALAEAEASMRAQFKALR